MKCIHETIFCSDNLYSFYSYSENLGSTPVASKGKSGKGKGASQGPYKDFSIEVAKSGRAGCKGCEVKILKVISRVLHLSVNSLCHSHVCNLIKILNKICSTKHPVATF